MFIRLKPRCSPSAPRRYAVQVCVSRRINGQPRQRVLYHLGVYQPEAGPAVGVFYDSVRARLARLPDVERVAIMARLEAVIPPQWPEPLGDPATRCQRRGHSWVACFGSGRAPFLCAWCFAVIEDAAGGGHYALADSTA